MGLNDLPNELLFCIADLLPYTWDLSPMCLVNHHFKDVFGKYLWMFNKQYDRKTTARWAARQGSETLIRRLVDEKLASGRLTQSFCDIPLTDSVDYGRTQIAEYLLDVRSRIPGPYEQPCSQEDKATSLLAGTAQSSGALVPMLLEKGADLYEPGNNKSLGLGISIGTHESVVDVILDRIQQSGRTDSQELTNFLYSELVYKGPHSYDHCILRFCKGLVELGADWNAPTKGNTRQD
ncbi:hypothetical protein BDW69DRAFT_187032 [Aspergillus filifer]